MSCEKTGCCVYIEEYGLWSRGDAHRVDGVYLFRLVNISTDQEPREIIHYRVKLIEEWWDRSNPPRCATLVARAENVVYYGYDGALTSQIFPSKEA